MKSSLTGASAVPKGFRGWMARRRTAIAVDIETSEASNVVWACGRRLPVEENELEERHEFAARRDRWPLGPSMDNFS